MLLLAHTGLRLGEALTLHWSDIGINSQFIVVRRNIYKGIVQAPKDGNERNVNIDPLLVSVLNTHKKASYEKGLKLGKGEIDIVFTNTQGNYILSDYWRQIIFKRIIKNAGIRKITPHLLRHTMASLHLSAGHNIVNVSKQFGHASVKMTLDVYGHFMPEQNRSEVDSFSYLYNPKNANKSANKHHANFKYIINQDVITKNS